MLGGLCVLSSLTFEIAERDHLKNKTTLYSIKLPYKVYIGIDANGSNITVSN